MEKNTRFKWKVRPSADPANLIQGRKYRLTILTPSLVRMEYSEQGIFENRASQSVFYRDFEPVEYTVCHDGDLLKIETEKLQITYKKEAVFTEQSLIFQLKTEPASCWHYGEAFEQLGGTTSTLDGINGPIALGTGVCSRNGFSVIDDSHRMVLNEDGWVEVRPSGVVDAYFFGYGFDYLGAVRDYYRLTGAPVMLPAYALGNWWSRYYRYTQQAYIDLMERFKEEDIPFSVAIVDMDWHKVESMPEEVTEDVWHQLPGWTGYSWNKELFPDYQAFLKYLSDNNLKTALNLHPADGCRCHEDMYEEMCEASGVDPMSRKKIPFDILSPEAMANYFDILLHPYEEAGVNFWWMDWQQGISYSWIHEPNTHGNLKDEREVLNPLWMLNHLHILDIQRGGKRPMYFSRFDGPGSQRYSIGFSGDTHMTWESLDFQPYFTATASNIGYCWWSHDIGGHMFGYRDDELTTRWVQLGVFSPINRLHSSNNPFNAKEPWAYPLEHETVMKRYLHLRAELFPYLYTMNYRTYKKLQPLIWPMYYTHPKCSGAYEAKNQFWFGSELMVAPITEPMDQTDLLGCAHVWLPQGVWFDFFHGSVYHSANGRNMDVFRGLEDYPVFAKAGAIVPQAVLMPHSNEMELPEELNVTVFPGADNCFRLFEDEGDKYGFEENHSVITEMNLKYTSQKACFTIRPAKGELRLIPNKRKWNLQFRGFMDGLQILAKVDGVEVPAEKKYDEEHHTMCVSLEAETDACIEVEIIGDDLIFNNADRADQCFNILSTAQIDFRLKNQLMNIINEQHQHTHSQIEAIYRTIPSMNHLARALKEQITLEQDEFHYLE